MEQEELRLVGTIANIIFESKTDFFKILRIQVDTNASDNIFGDEFVVTGYFAQVQLETVYEFFGIMTVHSKFGEQLKVSRYQQLVATSDEGLIEYLSSYRFKGIGKVLASRIVDKLGKDTVHLIIEDVSHLHDIRGLKQSTAKALREQLINLQGTERIFIQLNEWGISSRLADRIYQYYESKTLDIIKSNPYELVETIAEFSFLKADHLAEQIGIQANDMTRITAAVYVAVLQLSNKTGHTIITSSILYNMTRELLESSRTFLVSDELLIQGVEDAASQAKIIQVEQGYMLPSLYYAETAIARRLFHLTERSDDSFSDEMIDIAIEQLAQENNIIYDSSQIEAMKIALNAPISVITGGPGTGKTTIINAIIRLHSQLYDYDFEEQQRLFFESNIHLAAPTGRAAKRVQDAADFPASTIHRLIGFHRDINESDFSPESIKGTLLIIDEASMVDTWLMNWLLQAVPDTMQVVFVGDQDQLPSVGPGKVFADLIHSELIPTYALTQIYRQGQDSTIIQLASAIRKGSLPSDFLVKRHDRTFIPATTYQVEQAVENIVSIALNKGFDANTMQVLAPMYRGEDGIDNLNLVLQSILNPPLAEKREVVFLDQVFREGDKVLQLVNNTEDEVFNGDVGTIQRIYYKTETDSKSDEMVIVFNNNQEIHYKRNEFDQLKLAYCMSIHKSQGSEYPLVILPLTSNYEKMIRKDLLYTAVTRAQNSLIMIGNLDSFKEGVERQVLPRRTLLNQLICSNSVIPIKIEPIANQTQAVEQETAIIVEEEKMVEEESLLLTEEMIHQIDPMINMDNLTPYDFLS